MIPVVVFRVCIICIQRNVPSILESLRSSQGLVMRLICCLLRCAVAHSCKTSFVWGFSLLFLVLSSGYHRSGAGKNIRAWFLVPTTASSQPGACTPLALTRNWLLITGWYNWPVLNGPGANPLLCWWLHVPSMNYIISILILSNFRCLQD